MPSTLYQGFYWTVVGDTTVLRGYTPTQIEMSDEAFSTVLREEPPRARAQLGPKFSHLTRAVEVLLDLPGTAPVQPSYDVLKSVTGFLSQFGMNLIPPAVTPTSDGGVQLEWFSNSIGVELEFNPDGELTVLIDRDGDVEAHEVQDFNDPALLAALAFIRHDG